MAHVLEAVLLVGAVWTLIALQTSRFVWLALVAAGLLVWTRYGAPAPWVAVPVWLILLSPTLLIAITPLRRRLLSAPVFELFRRALPPMSDTERDALEAGTVWWEGELFRGAPDWRHLLDIPPARLSAAEQAFLDGPVEELCRLLDDWEITQRRYDLSEAAWAYLKAAGFFGMIIPRHYGGLEFSAYAHSCVVLKVASRSITGAVTVMVPNSLGPAKLLLHYGTEAQKDHYLPRLARGEEIPCFALTGPEAGSDAGAMPDTGVVCRGEIDGRETLGIRLNWDKRYITLAPVATVLGLAFRLQDPEHLLGATEDVGITLALIPTATPGVEIGRRHFPLNIPFQNGPTRGRDVFIPLDWIIGGPERAGQGWRMLMECLADGRGISLPALGTGAGKLASRATGAYAAVRKQFKQPIGRFEGVAEALARIGGNTYLMDAARTLTATALDLGQSPAVVTAIIKYHTTERMRRVVSDAMDIQGGSGICMGPRNFLGRVYEAVPISITVEGANILTRNLIIFGQGALRCHPHLLTELRAAQDADHRAGLKAFDQALFAHGALLAGNGARALFHGLTGARLARVPAGPTAHYFRQFTRMSAAFAFLADAAMVLLGGALKRRESLSARLGDALSYLYLGTAALKHFHAQGAPAEDLPLVRWACDEALFNIQQALLGMLHNFPLPFAGRVLRLITFPFGRPYHAPGDALGRRVADLLQIPGPARDRLTAGLYLPTAAGEPLADLEDALARATAARPVLRKLHKAMRAGELPRGDPEDRLDEALAAGVLEVSEAETVRAAVAARRTVIRVDDFSPEQLLKETAPWQSDPPQPKRAGPSTS